MKNIDSQSGDVNVFSSFRKRALDNLVKMIIAALDTRYVPISIEGGSSTRDTFATIFAMMKYPFLSGMLEKMGVSAIVELKKALHHPNLNVRITAMVALAKIGHPSVVDLLLPFLDTGESVEREWAVSALGITRSPLVFERIIAALEDRDLGVRESAIRALGDFGNESALPKLEKIAMSDKTLVESYGLTLGHIAREAIEKIQKTGKKISC